LGFALAPPTAYSATTAIVDPGHFADVQQAFFGEQDSTEQRISDALKRAFDMDVSVRCAPTWERSEESVTLGLATSELGHDMIRLDKERICDNLEGDINAILGGAPHGRDVERKRAVTKAVLIVSHEAAHHLYEAEEEAVTECQGYQNAQDLATAFGVTDAFAMDEFVYLLPFQHNRLTDDYMTTADCADGGLYDLQPTQVGGAFPEPGRLG
jgi:hypothetical protein